MWFARNWLDSPRCIPTSSVELRLTPDEADTGTSSTSTG